MNMIELHILQSFPVTCLNRDDLGAPKSALFGGVQRARVSSQCWKRAIRELATTLKDDAFKGSRTRKAANELTACLVSAHEWQETKARITAEAVLHLFLAKELPKAKKGKKDAESGVETQKEDTSTLLYFSPDEIKRIASGIHAAIEKSPEPDPKTLKEAAVKALGKGVPNDAVDIAVFGRMVANASDVTLEGAGMFSHALSTHKCDNELDFWTAVEDEKQIGDDAGAANMGTAEFNSACYYRYIAVNTDMLFDASHLASLADKEQRQAVLSAFIRASVLAVPSARKNSMFGFNPPAYVLGLRRAGQPISMVNAFEKPVTAAQGGYAAASETALKSHWAKLKGLYCLKTDTEAELPPDNLDALISKLIGASV
jgi:CRISPR system Cascade subunit CasC